MGSNMTTKVPVEVKVAAKRIRAVRPFELVENNTKKGEFLGDMIMVLTFVSGMKPADGIDWGEFRIFTGKSWDKQPKSEVYDIDTMGDLLMDGPTFLTSRPEKYLGSAGGAILLQGAIVCERSQNYFAWWDAILGTVKDMEEEDDNS